MNKTPAIVASANSTGEATEVDTQKEAYRGQNCRLPESHIQLRNLILCSRVREEGKSTDESKFESDQRSGGSATVRSLPKRQPLLASAASLVPASKNRFSVQSAIDWN